MSKQRVYWSTAEKRILAILVAEKLKQDPNVNTVYYVNAVQEESFPPERRRFITGMSQAPWLETAAYLHLKELHRLDALEEFATRPEPKCVSSLSDVELASELLGRLAKLLSPVLKPIVQDSVNESLATAFSQNMLDNAAKSAMATYLQSLNASASVPPRQTLDKKKKKKMVVLVGLKPNQYNDVQEEFGRFFDLRLWNAESNPMTQLKSLSANAFKIIGLVDFMSHDQTEAICSVNEPAYIRSSGGITTVKRHLADCLETA